MMLSCPNCKSRLARTTTAKGFIYLCAKCSGRAVAISVLRRQASRDFMKSLWRSSYGSAGAGGRNCPHCDRPMAEVQPDARQSPLTLDVCTRCHVVWFDPSEFEQIPAPSVSDRASEERMSPAAEAAAAQMRVEKSRPTGWDAWASDAPAAPDAMWKIIPAVFGMPVEMDGSPTVRRPVLTWGLSAAMAALLLILMGGKVLGPAVQGWGFIPNQWSRHFGLTIPAAFFLHAGVLHLVSNLYFFLVFGDNVEDTLGPVRFLALLAGAHLAGNLLHAAMDPRGDIPCVGASAGISGVIACYAVVFPHAKIGLFLWFRWLAIPAVGALILYAAVQLLGTWRQIEGFSNVSYLAHLGGMATGLVVGLLARRRENARPE